jgi:hypothetical protein
MNMPKNSQRKPGKPRNVFQSKLACLGVVMDSVVTPILTNAASLGKQKSAALHTGHYGEI